MKEARWTACAKFVALHLDRDGVDRRPIQIHDLSTICTPHRHRAALYRDLLPQSSERERFDVDFGCVAAVIGIENPSGVRRESGGQSAVAIERELGPLVRRSTQAK